MVYCIDIDGTLCTSVIANKYTDAEPFKKRIKKINALYDAGHIIILRTGRHWNSLRMTVDQLKRWGVKYHSFSPGKPPADLYVDDKAVLDTVFFGDEN